MAKPIFVRGIAPSMAGGPCRPRSSSKIIAPNREPLVFRTNLEKVGIALLRSNGRKGFAPSMEVCAPHRPVMPLLFIQNHCAKSGALVFRNELRKRVRTSHVGGSFFCWEWGGDRNIGEANLRKGAALQWLARPVPGWRTLRPLHPKSLRQIGELGFFGTNSGSVYEPFMGGSFLAGTGRG